MQTPNPRQLPAEKLGKGAVIPASYTEVAYAPGPENYEAPESPGIVGYFRILSRNKGTLILLAALGGLIGYLVTLPEKPIYRVRTSLEVGTANPDLPSLHVKDGNDNSDDDGVDIDTEIKLLQSESLLQRVRKKLSQTPVPPMPPSRLDAWRAALNLPVPPPKSAPNLMDTITGTQVGQAGDTRVIEVTVDSPNAQAAALFANTLANEFIDQSIENRWKGSEHTGEWLSRQLDDMRIRLEKSEDQLQRYANQAGLTFTDTEKSSSVSEERLSQVQQALSAAQTDRIVRQSRLEMAESSPPEALPDILNDSNLRDYDSKLTELNRQLAELRTTYKDDYSKVQRLLAQIDSIRSARQQAQGDIMRRIRNEYEEAVRKENLLQANYGKQRAIVTGEGEKAIQYSIYKREVESNRQLYDTMLQQLKQASLTSALRASNVTVIDPAQATDIPYKPNIQSNVIVGVFTGLIFAVLFVLIRERADYTIQEPGETTTFLNLPELGVIPADNTSFRLQLRQASNKRQEKKALMKAGSSPLAGRTELVAWSRNSSVVAESFRATLVSILFSGDSGGGRPRVMVVTSSNPGEGKSTVVSNLGIAIAEVNQRTLLIDADLRKPRLHDIFNLKNDRGLSEMLRSKDPVATMLEGAIQETCVPDLYVLTSGASTTAATSLLYSNRMPELLRMLRTEFETIIIDTPPMLHIPDARVLGRIVGNVILVVRAAKTTRAAATAARQRFSEDGTKMMGTILNDWNPKSSPNGYYGTYKGYSAYQNSYGSES